MSTEQGGAPAAEPAAAPATPTRSDRLASAKAMLSGEPAPAAEPVAEPAAAPDANGESRPPKVSSLYETIADRDAQIRELQQQLKAADSNKPSGDIDLSQIPDADLWDALTARAAVEAVEETEGQSAEATQSAYDEKIAALEAKVAEFEKAQAAQRDKAVKDEFHASNHAYIEANPEKYPLIRALRSEGSYKRVLDHAIEFVQTYGKAPDQQILLDVVEETLFAEKKAEYDKYNAIFSPAVPVPETKTPAATATAPARTLDDVPLEGTPTPQAMTREDRKKRALALLQGKTID